MDQRAFYGDLTMQIARRPFSLQVVVKFEEAQRKCSTSFN